MKDEEEERKKEEEARKRVRGILAGQSCRMDWRD
jgi:hypothetical protein